MQLAKKSRNIQWALYVMVLPALVLVLIYSYGPLGGLVIAFQRFDITLGIFKSEWVGLDNYKFLMMYPNIINVVWNTFFISIMKIVAHLIVPVIVAMLINEMKSRHLKRNIQSAIYLPHFVSWVVISGMILDVLSPGNGIVNKIISLVGIEPIYFLGNPKLFPFVLVMSDMWKEFGYGTIIYLAALTSIDQSLYEAAEVDGATRFQRALHITLPGITHIMVLLGTLSLGRVLNAGFDQVFNLYNPQVYSTGDIIDTLNYRMGLEDAQYDLATAVGLFKSVISLILVSTSYYLARKFANYKIF